MTTATLVKQAILGLVSTTCLVVGTQSAQAMTFEGSSTGELEILFSSPDPNFTLSDDGGTRNRFDWSIPETEAPSNFVRFDGVSAFSAGVNEVFKVGRFTYRNSSRVNGLTTLFSLNLPLNLTAPSVIQPSFTYLFGLLNIPQNFGSPLDDRSLLAYVPQLNFFPQPASFEVDRTRYTLELLGFSPDDEKQLMNAVDVPEGETSTAEVYARFIAEPIPTPALLPGLIGLGISAIRKRKAEAAAQLDEA